MPYFTGLKSLMRSIQPGIAISGSIPPPIIVNGSRMAQATPTVPSTVLPSVASSIRMVVVLPGRAKQAERLPRMDLEGDPIDHNQGAKGFTEIRDPDHADQWRCWLPDAANIYSSPGTAADLF